MHVRKGAPRMNRKWIAAALAASVCLSACAGGQTRRGPPAKVIDRALASAPGEAQPSTIVATEVAYAREARETGQFTAGTAYALPNAVQHGRNGPVPFSAIAQSEDDPPEASQWKPRAVVMSCDGALALSMGRFRDSRGLVGNYVTTWVRQRDNDYKWAYDVAGYDDPQPSPRPEFADGDIVVTAMDSVAGLVATCPRGEEGRPPAPPSIAPPEDATSGTQMSRDGTLRWHWEHRADGIRYVKADYWYEGAWETAIEERLASPIDQ